jgi:hypothetical protein
MYDWQNEASLSSGTTFGIARNALQSFLSPLRLRRGENVAAPLNVQISDKKN